MWTDLAGNNLTSAEIAARLERSVGASYSVTELERAYRVGSIYHNGGIWFQRLR